MAAENSFDIVSNVEIPEVQNAIQQALKEITQRYDLKGSHSNVEFDGKAELTLTSADDYKLKAVTDRMNDMRAALKASLVKNGTKGNWDHVTSQIGMFSFLGLTPKQCEQMIQKHHIYMTSNGRISIAGLTTANVDYVANAIKDVVDNY